MLCGRRLCGSMDITSHIQVNFWDYPYLVIKCPQQTCSMVLDNWMLLFLGLNDKESDTDLGDKNRPMIMYFSVHLGLVSFHMCIKGKRANVYYSNQSMKQGCMLIV